MYLIAAYAINTWTISPNDLKKHAYSGLHRQVKLRALQCTLHHPTLNFTAELHRLFTAPHSISAQHMPSPVHLARLASVMAKARPAVMMGQTWFWVAR
jgi:hypothetical protein